MKWYDYILYIIIIVLLIYIIYIYNNKEIQYYYIYKDTTIIKLLDTIEIKEKTYYQTKTKLQYEYKTDSILIYLLPDTTLWQDIMSRSRYILSKGFIDTSRSSTVEVPEIHNIIRTADSITTRLQNRSRFSKEKIRKVTRDSN